MAQKLKWCAVILAGGKSSRFGIPKPIAMVNNHCFLEIILSNLNELKSFYPFLSPSLTVLVLEEESKEKVLSAMEGIDCSIIIQTDPESKQADSLRLGIKAFRGYDYYLSYPIDFPLVKSQTIRNLIETAVLTKADLVSPVFEGKRGHPFLLSSKASSVLMRMEKELPLSSLFEINELSTQYCHVDDSSILKNLNTPKILREITC